jgi:hypothetical protein
LTAAALHLPRASTYTGGERCYTGLRDIIEEMRNACPWAILMCIATLAGFSTAAAAAAAAFTAAALPAFCLHCDLCSVIFEHGFLCKVLLDSFYILLLLLGKVSIPACCLPVTAAGSSLSTEC